MINETADITKQIADCDAKMKGLNTKLRAIQQQLEHSRRPADSKKEQAEEDAKILAAYHANPLYQQWLALKTQKEELLNLNRPTSSKDSERTRSTSSEYSSTSPRFLREAASEGKDDAHAKTYSSKP